LIGLIK